ncbi:MAG: pyridoxamine 5'-phosphate oxidase [bacterium]
MTDASTLRARFSAIGLSRDSADADPLAQFDLWLAQAREAGVAEPNAMLLATVSSASAPSQRSVLMKTFDQRGVLFFTNHVSRKARQMRGNDAVSAVFPWYPLHRQVIVEGRVEPIGDGESRAYFQSRPRQAQLGAWASRQSEALESRRALEERLAAVAERFGDGEVPLPEFWGGYRIAPDRIEFWQGRDHRLHDRILYTRAANAWTITRLFP